MFIIKQIKLVGFTGNRKWKFPVVSIVSSYLNQIIIAHFLGEVSMYRLNSVAYLRTNLVNCLI